MSIYLKGSSRRQHRSHKKKLPTKAEVLANTERYTNELYFIEQYLEIRSSNFLHSIKTQIRQGHILSDKQKEVLDRIIENTDFEQLKQQGQIDILRFNEILQMFEVLDRVRFGQYPSEAFYSIERQFALSGSITDKQLELLKKLKHRFRNQIAKL